MRLAIFVCFSLLACNALARESTPQTIRLTMEWNLSMDAQGNITRLDARQSYKADQVPKVRERLNLAIHSWKFSSGTINGKPAPADTVLSVDVALIPQGNDTYRIRVEDARTGGHISKTVAPHYPHDAVADHITGMVVMHVSYDADGSVVSTTPEPGAPRVSASLVRAAAAAIKQWQFQPERVDGHGVAGTAVVPTCFTLSDVGWPPPAMNCQWTAPGHAAISEGQSLTLEPAARLLTEIAGSTL